MALTCQQEASSSKSLPLTQRAFSSALAHASMLLRRISSACTPIGSSGVFMAHGDWPSLQALAPEHMARTINSCTYRPQEIHKGLLQLT